MKPTRPLLRYHGGKWRLAPWIISYFPAHRTYTESYGGAGSILLLKDPAYAEVYNDLDGEVVNLFRVLRNPAEARELIRQVRLTPYARAEFDASYITADDPIEMARRTLFRSAAGFSSTGASGVWKTGFRGNVTRSGTTPAHAWRNLPDTLHLIVERLQGVIIENLPALDVIRTYDGPDALHYVDPPYVFATRYGRWTGKAYKQEMTDKQHRELAFTLHNVKGNVVLSGYACPLYDELYGDWARVTKETHADSAKDRIEVLWLKCSTNLPLFNVW